MGQQIQNASTREQILDNAESLLQRYGYTGFSFDDIAKTVGIKKPSIHHHFASKAILGAEVVKRYSARFAAALQQIQIKHTNALACLQNYVNLFVSTYQQERNFCVCGMLGAQVDTLPEALAEAIYQFFVLNQNWLAKVLQKGEKQGELSFIGKPQQRALQLLASLEGAMVVGRALKNDTVMQQIGKAVLADLAP